MVFFRHPKIRYFSLVHRQSQLEKITCPEYQMYDSDNTDNWFRHPCYLHCLPHLFFEQLFNWFSPYCSQVRRVGSRVRGWSGTTWTRARSAASWTSRSTGTTRTRSARTSPTSSATAWRASTSRSTTIVSYARIEIIVTLPCVQRLLWVTLKLKLLLRYLTLNDYCELR